MDGIKFGTRVAHKLTLPFFGNIRHSLINSTFLIISFYFIQFLSSHYRYKRHYPLDNEIAITIIIEFENKVRIKKTTMSPALESKAVRRSARVYHDVTHPEDGKVSLVRSLSRRCSLSRPKKSKNPEDGGSPMLRSQSTKRLSLRRLSKKFTRTCSAKPVGEKEQNTDGCVLKRSSSKCILRRLSSKRVSKKRNVEKALGRKKTPVSKAPVESTKPAKGCLSARSASKCKISFPCMKKSPPGEPCTCNLCEAVTENEISHRQHYERASGKETASRVPVDDKASGIYEPQQESTVSSVDDHDSTVLDFYESEQGTRTISADEDEYVSIAYPEIVKIEESGEYDDGDDDDTPISPRFSVYESILSTGKLFSPFGAVRILELQDDAIAGGETTDGWESEVTAYPNSGFETENSDTYDVKETEPERQTVRALIEFFSGSQSTEFMVSRSAARYPMRAAPFPAYNERK